MEVSFHDKIASLRLGDGDTFHGEGILAVTKALLQSGVSYVGGYQGAPVSHLLDVLVDAEDIIGEEVQRMMLRLKTREAAPTIVKLQEQLDGWRKESIDRVRGKLGPLTPQQEEAIDALTRGLVNKIAHGPITELRKQSSDPNLLDMVRRLFRLGGDE